VTGLERPSNCDDEHYHRQIRDSQGRDRCRPWVQASGDFGSWCACHPRDLVNQVCWKATYEGREPRLDQASLMRAAKAYFPPPN
jgi:hypothetical protein